ncbi:MAG: hypothetical protein H7Y18_04020 [Clostridiaceae bacterium]|nr:hypothetical protein [Clostridiaceae bacterium]
MKETFQVFSMDIKRAFGSIGFFVAVLGVGIVYYTGARTLFGYADILLMFKYVTEASSFNHIVILFCVLPYTTSFCSDWNSKYIRLVVIRMGPLKYAVCKIITCAVSSGTAMVLGIILFILPLTLRIPLVDTYSRFSSYESFVTTLGGGFLLNGHYIMYFAVYIYLMFLTAAFWSIVGLCASTYIPNKFVALFTPFIGLYVLSNITSKFPNWLRLDKVINGECIINGTFVSLIYATLFVTVLIAGVGLLFYENVERRISNE